MARPKKWTAKLIWIAWFDSNPNKTIPNEFTNSKDPILLRAWIGRKELRLLKLKRKKVA